MYYIPLDVIAMVKRIFKTQEITGCLVKARFQQKTKQRGRRKKYIKTLEIAQFSENFEEQIIICRILKDMTIEIK